MGYTIVRPEDRIFERPSWRPDETVRGNVELNRHASLSYSRANLWRYPAGARGRRHRETVQEEVFVMLEGTFTMLLGGPSGWSCRRERSWSSNLEPLSRS